MSIQVYAEWLLKDQCKGLLNMTSADLAKVLGVSRPTVDVYMADPSKMTAEKIDKLANHLEFVKAAILLTEAEL